MISPTLRLPHSLFCVDVSVRILFIETRTHAGTLVRNRVRVVTCRRRRTCRGLSRSWARRRGPSPRGRGWRASWWESAARGAVSGRFRGDGVRSAGRASPRAPPNAREDKARAVGVGVCVGLTRTVNKPLSFSQKTHHTSHECPNNLAYNKMSKKMLLILQHSQT